MAKITSPIGTLRGKLGGSVFVLRNGQRIVRELNPAPANPKTDLQNAQRAKGNLAGRISSLVPKSAIFGLGSNAPRRRARFLSILLKAAISTLSDNVWRAKIADGAIYFSEGAVIQSVTTPSFAATANRVNVTLTGVSTEVVSAEAYASMLTRLVVMVYDYTTNDLVEVVTRIANKPAQLATEITAININHPTGYTAVIYAVPMSSSDGSAVSITTDMAERDDAAIAASLTRNANGVVFEYGRSVLLGQVNFTPSTANANVNATSKSSKK